jgi:hypothetical protein
MNLRGIRESGTAFAIPTYAFMFGMFACWSGASSRSTCWAIRSVRSRPSFTVHAEHGDVLVALVFLVARAFSSGCAALTGVEAISNGVPAFRSRSPANAATTLLMLGSIAVALLMGIIVLAKKPA